MGLFGKKSKEDKGDACCCGDFDAKSMAKAESAKAEGASVKILGTGCSKCNALEAATRRPLKGSAWTLPSTT